MADSGEGNTASSNPKEKISLIDEEIGKDFLSSWKSMSVTEDDTMDLGFDAVPNGNKKFNFDKLDMDFNLDGDFDKLSSFKVDMPDLDFSCPSKKKAKTKERTEEDSLGGKHQGKNNPFNFSFDFNDEDFANDAQIGSKLIVNSKSLIRELTDDEPIFLRNEKRNVNSPSSIREGFNFDGVKNGSQLVGDLRPQDEQGTQREPSMLGSEKNAGEVLHATDIQSGSELVGNSKSITRELTEGEHGLVSSENNIKDLSDVSENVKSDGLQNESKLVFDARPQDKQVAEGETFMPGSERSTREDVKTNDDVQISNGLVGKSLSRELTKNEPVSLGIQKNVQILSNVSEGVNANDDVQVSKKSVGSKSLSRELTKNEPSLGSEKDVKVLSNIREIVNADGMQNGSKVSNSRAQDTEAPIGEPVTLRSERSSGEVINADDVQNCSKGGISRAQDKEATIRDSVKLRIEKNPGFQVNPSSLDEKTPKASTQASGNPKFVISSMHSIRNLKNVSVEGLKTGKTTPDLSSLKNLRTIRANKDMPNSTVLRQSSTFRNLEQTIKLPGITTSSIAHRVGGTEKQKPSIPSLKRKKIEESNADLVCLKPLRHLFESPKESRNPKEPLGRVIEGEVCGHENQGQSKIKTVLHEHSTSGLEVARDVSMTEMEIPVFTENDGNVEKAEAYTKELEDICNMLKKKHEEAKEIVVQAIVNNNNLLMLNHPIHEEKIRMVQKFATELMCKEIPT